VFGFVVGMPSLRGEPVPSERACEHVFGLLLVNDWSARDIQAWEYQPLGPFLGKSFATSISAWVVPLDELADRRVELPPQQLAHATSNGASLRTGDLMASGTISGPEPGSEGSFIELWQNSRFLEDGDEVVLRGRTRDAELGEVRGRVLPAR